MDGTLHVGMVMNKLLLALVAGIVLVGCEKVVIEDGYTYGDADGNVTLTVMAKNIGLTRGSEVGLGEACGRLSIAIFDNNGKKVKTVSQTAADNEYGTVKLSLPDGSYTVVVIGHNGNGNATITSIDKVTFPNNKVTDTFCYCEDLDVEGKIQTDIVLERVVSMVRLRLDDNGEDMDIASLKFYYLGGSSTLSPATGYGCVNSKQTEIRAWNEEGVYELYTMPHSHSDELTRMTVTAYDAGDNVIGEWTLEHIPVTLNRVTEYSGNLFGGSGGSGGNSTNILVNTEWDGVDEYSF